MTLPCSQPHTQLINGFQGSIFHATHSRIKPKQKVSRRWRNAPDIKYTGCPTTWSGTSIPKRSRATWEADQHSPRWSVVNIIKKSTSGFFSSLLPQSLFFLVAVWLYSPQTCPFSPKRRRRDDHHASSGT